MAHVFFEPRPIFINIAGLRYSMGDCDEPEAELCSGAGAPIIKTEVDASGTKRWYREGKLHREDGPAIEYANGDKVWFRSGERHREDGPAVEYADGSKEWWIDGKLHREDGPALECWNGDKEWHLHGVRKTKREHTRKMVPPRLLFAVCASRRNHVPEEKHCWLPAELWGAPRGEFLCSLTESARQLDGCAAHVF